MKDFSVKKLSEYPDKELETLYAALLIVKASDHADQQAKYELDIWMYRIAGARKEIRNSVNEYDMLG